MRFSVPTVVDKPIWLPSRHPLWQRRTCLPLLTSTLYAIRHEMVALELPDLSLFSNGTGPPVPRRFFLATPTTIREYQLGALLPSSSLGFECSLDSLIPNGIFRKSGPCFSIKKILRALRPLVDKGVQMTLGHRIAIRGGARRY